MPSRNELTIMGHLGRDAEVKADGRLLSFSVACSEKYKTRTGEEKETTTWITVKWWSEKFAAVMASQLKKGALVAVFGAFATEKYTGKDGAEKTMSYCKARLVVPCSWPRDGASQPQPQTTGCGYDEAEYGGESQGGDAWPF